MRRVSLKCFGVGDGWPCADRRHSSFLYRFGETTLLIDCGESVSSAYKAAGYDYNLVDRLLLSHLHGDHVGGFLMLMQGFWLERREKDLPIHLPADGIQPLRQLLEAAMIFDELLGFRMQFKPLETERAFQVKGVRITPFPTSHLESLRLAHQRKHPLAFQAFSFLLETQNLRVAHSADLGAPEDLEPLLEKPVDLLVCELAHFKPADLFRYLKGRPIKRIGFMHVARPYWENLSRVQKHAEKLLGGIPFSFLKDGEEIAI